MICLSKVQLNCLWHASEVLTLSEATNRHVEYFFGAPVCFVHNWAGIHGNQNCTKATEKSKQLVHTVCPTLVADLSLQDNSVLGHELCSIELNISLFLFSINFNKMITFKGICFYLSSLIGLFCCGYVLTSSFKK